MANSLTRFPDFTHDAGEFFQLDNQKKYHGFLIYDKTWADPYYHITGADRTRLKEEIKIIRATRKANGGLGGKYTLLKDDKKLIDARPIDTNKVMRSTIKEVKKIFKAENIPDAQLWDGDLSEFEIEETPVNDTLQWIRNLLGKKDDDTPFGMGIGTTASASPKDKDIKPKDNKPQSTAWNVAGITLAVVSISLITWGVVSYIKTQKKKKAAAASAASTSD